MSVLEDLVEAFLLNNVEVSSVYNRVSKEVIFDEKAGQDLIVIPQITSKEAYGLMVQFAKEQKDPATEQLLAMLQEKKPFNKFKSQLHLLDLGDAWYEFENEYARGYMTAWLEENQ